MSEPYPANHWTGADTGEQWDLCLYVTGSSPRGQRAIEHLRRACEEHLKGHYQIEVVDVLKNPGRAAADQILAASRATARPVRVEPATPLPRPSPARHLR